MVDSRRPAHFSFIRRPSYYATLNAGQQITSFQRLGLGLMWNDQFGAAMQTQANTNSATWGTRASGQSAPYEASTINTTYTINGAGSPVQNGSRRLADGNFGAAYPLGSAGSKAISFTDSGVTVNISHTGSFTEVLPLLRRSNETISLSPGRISLTRGNATFAVVFDPSISVTRNTPGISPGDGQVIENFTLAGTGSLSYTMRFELVVPSIVSGDRAGGVQDDVFRLVRKGSVAQLMLNSDLVPDVQWDIASPPSSLQIRGLGGNDTLIIDLSGGHPLPASGLSFDG
ncbi:MAG TPA: hypothetical protein PKB10_08465, partial [Tepidisphaeraceae bacterium]|nr:hypothetical protein [Tepidisphaeraceae bacterium]